jgi:hypothetical protein
MSFDPRAWSWPQWAIAVLYVLALARSAAMHGKDRVDGDGKPDRYNFPAALMAFSLVTFFLIAGGFFGGSR